MPDIRIASVSIEALHDQFDVDLEFKPGLNIIYGKNGTGKTTILHLLANALELDFKRFAFLQFKRIAIRTNNNDVVELSKEASTEALKVTLNGNLMTFSEGSPNLSEAELASLREALGSRPTYLPAFRSVLERARTDTHTYYRVPDRRDPEYDEIVEREFGAFKETMQRVISPGSYEHRVLSEEAATTAQKTTLCRQWFGRFVPVIRYPSVSDVDDGLTEEWRIAQLEVTRREQRMFEEIFVKVFRTIAGIEQSTAVENNDGLLASIADLLKGQESQLATAESSDIYNNLLIAVKSVDSSSTALRGIDNSLLDIYRQVLEKRNTERRLAFQRSQDFEASVNKFLDRKTFRIGQQGSARSRARSAVSVVTEAGHGYGIAALSSGERQILTMLYSASRTKFLSGIFLIDEPELSLHIDWQRIVLRELQKQASDRQIIACTHSPEVGADHMDDTQDFEPGLTRKRQGSLFSEEEL